jgi:hypothetical protein
VENVATASVPVTREPKKYWTRQKRKVQRSWKPDKWPDTPCCSVCWNCAFEIPDSHLPLIMPMNYDAQTNTFHCKGLFCTWSCMSRYQRETCGAESHTSEFMRMLYTVLHGEPPPGGTILPSPPRHRLTIYGGDLTIEEFREGLLSSPPGNPRAAFEERYESKVQREVDGILSNMERRRAKLPDRSLVEAAVRERLRPLQVTHTVDASRSRGKGGIMIYETDEPVEALSRVQRSQKPENEERMRVKRLKLERTKPFKPESQKTLSSFFA